MTADGDAPLHELFHPSNEGGDVTQTLTLTLREVSALSVCISFIQNAKADEMMVTEVTEQYGETVGTGFMLALTGAALQLTTAMSKATDFGDGKLRSAAVSARLDQLREQWREAA